MCFGNLCVPSILTDSDSGHFDNLDELKSLIKKKKATCKGIGCALAVCVYLPSVLIDSAWRGVLMRKF